MNSIQVGAITTDMVIETVVSHAGSGVCAVAQRRAGARCWRSGLSAAGMCDSRLMLLRNS